MKNEHEKNEHDGIVLHDVGHDFIVPFRRAASAPDAACPQHSVSIIRAIGPRTRRHRACNLRIELTRLRPWFWSASSNGPLFAPDAASAAPILESYQRITSPESELANRIPFDFNDGNGWLIKFVTEWIWRRNQITEVAPPVADTRQ